MSSAAGKAALILIATFVVYIPAMTAGFIWDDAQLLTQNPQIHDPAGIWKLWVAPATADYFPLTSSLLWIEFRLGKVFDMWNVDWLLQRAADGALNGYHLVNILFHGIAAVLTWRVLRVLGIPGAWLAALIFAVHPVCVESVAWISELKNTLSQVLFLLTLLVYQRFETHERLSTYLGAVILFSLALTAKASVVALPVMLWLCAWWLRGEITRRDLMRSLPFFAVALILGIVTIYFQSSRAIGTEIIPIGGVAARIAQAGVAVCFYISKAIWPLNLSPIYETWKVSPPAWSDFLPVVALIAVCIACWRWRAQAWARAALFALGSYIIMLLPVLGFVPMSYMRLTLVADHFQYLALTSIIALVVAAAMRWLPRPAWTPLAAVIVVLLGGLSWTQAAIYHNEETLWTAALRRTPDSWQAHNHLGVALWKKGDMDSTAAAFKHFQRAAELKPENPEAHNNLALGYATRGQMDLAIAEYQKAISLKDDAAVRTNLGIAFGTLKRYAEAEEQYRAALEMDPGNASRYANLGYALMQQGRVREAIEQFEKALQIDPNLSQARQNLRFIMDQRQRRQVQTEAPGESRRN